MTAANGNISELRAQLAVLEETARRLQSELERSEAKREELQGENDWLKKMNVHNQDQWLDPFDPKARVQ